MKNTAIWKRLLSFALCAALVLSFVPGGLFGGVDAAEETAFEKVADPATHNGWTEFFGPDKLSTEFSGGVWTDKSVFEDASAFSGVTLNGDNNFLVALSALSATTEIKGQSSTPTDVMLVLDLSNSMDSSRSIPDMVEATNKAIDTLLNDNSYNRVGVVLYSGNTSTNNDATPSTATVILPLDRYTAGTWNGEAAYLNYTGNSSNTTVNVASGVKNSKGNTVTGSKQTNGGTYIQNGLFKAWQEFEKVTDTVVTGTGTSLDGTKRLPIIVLMSDGAPTVATQNYYGVTQNGVTSIGNNTYGNGSSNYANSTSTFLTQLTAAWVEAKVSDHYGTDTKFYTLGLGTASDANATGVLYPKGSNTTVTGWWNSYLALADGATLRLGNNNSPRVTRQSIVTAMNYVDNYWYASNSAELIKQFESITGEIQLQSATFSTLVEAAGSDLSGYVSFEDEIGELMEIKKVKGILLDGVLFTGAELAKGFENGVFGGTGVGSTEMGDELLRTMQERIGLSESEAQQLAASVFAAGQIYYNSDSDYSNYIGWYSDVNGAYLGFWQESYGFGMENAPAGAVYINKSYGFLGESGSSDLMHVVVNTRMEIATSHQDVLFRIPAGMLPMVTYEVELDGAALSDGGTMTYKAAQPIRLLYEVGLRSDITSLNIDQKVAEYLAADPDHHHVHQHEDGTYEFFTNTWGDGHGNTNPTIAESILPYVTESHFSPAVDNDRYYYTEDTPIYVKNGDSYTLYTGSAAPTGEGYYRVRTLITATSNGGEISTADQYLPISTRILDDGYVTKTGDGHWVVNKGTAFREVARFEMEKSENRTGSLIWEDHPLVVYTGAADSSYAIYAVLGNNGKLTVTPAQGIRVSKTVSEPSEDSEAPTEFEFEITLTPAVAENALSITDTEGNAWPTTDYSVAVSADKTVIELTLTDGEEVLITGLPTGTTYTVEEHQTVYYNTEYTDDKVTGTVVATEITDVPFVNAPRELKELQITKTVLHPFDEDPAGLRDKTFYAKVTLTDKAAGHTFYDSTGKSYVADASGAFVVELHDESAVTIVNILEDTPYTVEEIDVPDGFAFVAGQSSGLTGTVPGAAHIVNEYKPGTELENPNVTVTVNKVVSGDPNVIEEFRFSLQMLDPDDENADADGYVTLEELKILYPDTDTVSFDLTEVVKTLTSIGSYTFRIMEQDGGTVGMTYSSRRASFRVDVIDPELDGKPAIEVVNLINTVVTDSTNAHTVTTEFENIYAVDSTHVDIPILKRLVNDTGVELDLTGFRFGLFANAEDTEPLAGYTVYAGPTGHAVIRVPVTNVNQNGTVYYLKEIVPAEKRVGMTYSDAVYKVTLSVGVMEGADSAYLTANATIEPYSGSAVMQDTTATFENEFDLGKTTATILGDKNLLRGYDNAPMNVAAGSFRFELWTANADYTAGELLQSYANGVNGNFSFDPIYYHQVGTYAYIVREVVGNEDYITYDIHDVYVLVVVTEDGNGGLTSAVYYRKSNETSGSALAQFTNIYNVSGSDTVPVSGHKTLNVLQGSKTLTGGEFTFELKQDGVVIDTATNLPSGLFTFKDLTFTAADAGKTFTYTVSEKKENHGGIDYDDTVYTFTVEVKDMGDGTIDAVYTLSGGRNAIEFVNDYSADSTTASFSGTKTLTGRATPMTAGEFTFELYKSDKDFASRTWLKDITHAADGTFSFTTEEYTATGIYYYVLHEKIPTGEDRPAGMHYDAGEYHLTVHVVDRGVGKLETTTSIYRPGAGNTPIVFANNYLPVEVDVDLTATKTYDKTLSGGEFTFGLKQGDEVLETVTNGAGGTITFSTLTFREQGTYTYTVYEVPGDKDYITYDGTEYTVTITVTDANGELAADVQVSGETGQMTFKNTYVFKTGGSLELTGTKTLTGNRTTQTAGEFKFEVKDAAGAVVSRGENDASGNIVFETISYTHADIGTHEYTVYEVQGANEGMTYDTTEYNVVVTVADNGEGGITVTHTVDGADNKAITFQNAYTITGNGEMPITGTKVLSGRELEAGEFSFKLATADGAEVETVKNAAGGAITFTTLQFGPEDLGQHTYVVTEIDDGKGGVDYDDTAYTVVITVADNGNGGITVTKTVDSSETKEIIFRNSYAADGEGSALIAGVKTLTGDRTEIRENEFSFLLKDTSGAELETVKAATDGSFAFTELTYTEADLGEHRYSVCEVKGNNEGMTYDTKVYEVVVTVADNGLGGITVTKTVDGKTDTAITFQNTYTIEDTEELVLSGTKVLTGRAPDSGEFTFKLSKDGAELQTVTNVGGAFTFGKLTFTQADIGTHTYVITEVSGNNPGVTYSGESYTVLVTVADDGNGGITVTKTVNGGDTPIVFNNKYEIKETAELKLEGNKTLTGDRTAQTAGEFKFVVMEGDKQVAKGENDENGKIVFETITYTAADIGTHTYKVTEVEGNNDGMTYDATEYTVKVTVADNKQGGLTVNATDLPTLTFANSYNITRPGELNLTGTKTLTGNRTTQTAGEFKFVVMEGDKQVSKGENDAEGNIRFETISYTAADIGEHTYTVSEVNLGKPGVGYDTATYTVKVTVADDGNGGISVSATELPIITFQNTYTITGSAELILVGGKTLANRDLTEGEFEFEVKDETGNVVATGKNDATGKVTFSAITYTVADLGEHTYTVTEKSGDLYGVAYDNAAYTVVVQVSDNGNGGLTVTKTADPVIAFTNVYTPDLDVTISVEKQVETTATTLPSVKGFEFKLVDVATGETVGTVTSDEQGLAAIHVTYSKADAGKTFTYKLTETKGSKTGWEYDTTEYLITVTVTLNADGTLSATKTVNETAVEEVSVTFRNTYKPPITPGTGDDFKPVFVILLMLCAALGAVLVLLFRRKQD